MYIFQEITQTITIKKSEFITYICPVNSEEDARSYIDTIKEMHKDANHVCSCYVIGNHDEISRNSDDGEPSGTAGMPMLLAVKKEDCHDVVVCVVRYFGGIKLGASGLTRAYASCITDTLRLATKAKKVKLYIYSIHYPYDSQGALESFLRQIGEVRDVVYDEDIACIIATSDTNFPNLLISQSKNKASYSLLREEDAILPISE